MLLLSKGGWENDETVEEAAARESMEEAGVQGDLMVKNFPHICIDIIFEFLCKAVIVCLSKILQPPLIFSFCTYFSISKT